MRLLVYTQDFPPRVGGIETYSWELARRWAREVEHVVVLCPSHPESARIDRAAPFAVVRTRIPDDLLALGGALPLAATAARHRVDAAFLAQWQPGAGALPLRRVGALGRLFIAAHGRELLLRPFSGAAQAAMDGLRRRVLGGADALFPVSHYTAGLIARIGVRHPAVHVVPNGADPERFSPGDGAGFRARHGLEGRPLLLTIGRLVARKGIDDVLRALPAVLGRVPGALYAIAGDGPDRGRLEGLGGAGGGWWGRCASWRR